MKIFLTGATGFVGSQLAIRLANNGHKVHALVRSVNRAKIQASHENIRFFEGNLDDETAYTKAITDCEQGYLLAAYAQVWNKNPEIFYNINVTANLNLIKACHALGVQKVVLTSTAGVFGPSQENEEITENSELWTELTTHYEKSKLQAENEIKEYTKNSKNHVVIVNPTRVYGPGKLSASNSVTRMIKEFYEGKWHVYPGNGKALGNYVHVKDVINGHLLAMEKGKSGENYILSGENATYRELFEKTSEISGRKTWLVGIPIWVMMLIAKIQMALIPLTKKGPLLTPGFVKKYTFNWKNSSNKAKLELGYTCRNLDKGIKSVIDWVEKKHTH